MKTTKYIMLVMVSLIFSVTNAQIKNPITIIAKIGGNCETCKSMIEEAGNAKKAALVNWDINSKIATITFDTEKTTKNDVLKRIALAGFDSEEFLAPADIYSNLPNCCRYERINIPMALGDPGTMRTSPDTHIHHEHDHNHPAMKQEEKSLVDVIQAYFEVKDALVKTDAEMASAKAKTLQSAIAVIEMETLTTDEHIAWMDLVKPLTIFSREIADTKEIEKQRESFIELSSNMYVLMKATNMETPVYYQFCPMANDGKGANWLSKESTIKNPYYGSKMLGCGKTVETIE